MEIKNCHFEPSWQQRAEAAEAWVKTAERTMDYQANLITQLGLRAEAAEAKLAEYEKQEPAGKFEFLKDEDGDTTNFIVQSDGFSNESFPLFTRPVPAVSLAELVPEKASMADYYENVRSGEIDPEEAGIAMWNACRAAILRNIEEASSDYLRT